MRTLSVVAAIISVAFSPLEIHAVGSPAMPQVNQGKIYGALEETPNQRRRRLGQEITASYPPVELGETLETPNQRRIRLGQPIQASYEPPAPGVAEETPNHRKERLAQSLSK